MNKSGLKILVISMLLGCSVQNSLGMDLLAPLGDSVKGFLGRKNSEKELKRDAAQASSTPAPSTSSSQGDSKRAAQQATVQKQQTSSPATTADNSGGGLFALRMNHAPHQLSEDTKSFLSALAGNLKTIVDDLKKSLEESQEISLLSKMKKEAQTLQGALTTYLEENADDDPEAQEENEQEKKSHQATIIVETEDAKKRATQFYLEKIKPTITTLETHFGALKKLLEDGNVQIKPDNDQSTATKEELEAQQNREKKLKHITTIGNALKQFESQSKQQSESQSNSMSLTPIAAQEPEKTYLALKTDFCTKIDDLQKVLETAYDEFREIDRGISATINDKIDTFTEKLNTIVDKLSLKLQTRLSDVIGYSALIKIRNKIKQLIGFPIADRTALMELKTLVASTIVSLEPKKESEDATRGKQLTVSPLINQLNIMLTNICQAEGLVTNKYAFKNKLEDIEKDIELMINTQGGLIAVFEHLTTDLQTITMRLTTDLKGIAEKLPKDFGEHMNKATDRLGSNINHVVDYTAPRTGKKWAGYAVIASTAAIASGFLFLKENKTGWDYAKGIGVMVSAFPCMLLWDKLIDWWQPAKDPSTIRK